MEEILTLPKYIRGIMVCKSRANSHLLDVFLNEIFSEILPT